MDLIVLSLSAINIVLNTFIAVLPLPVKIRCNRERSTAVLCSVKKENIQLDILLVKMRKSPKHITVRWMPMSLGKIAGTDQRSSSFSKRKGIETGMFWP